MRHQLGPTTLRSPHHSFESQRTTTSTTRSSESEHEPASDVDSLGSGKSVFIEDVQARARTPSKPELGKSRCRCFGIGKSISTYHQQGYNADDYEQKYPEDKPGDEMGPNARFYRVYLDEHEKFRFEMVEAWKDNLDVLLVFAGLFSAVLTAMIIESSKNLQPDYAELTTTLLLHQSAILTQLLDLQKGVSASDVPPLPAVNMAFVASNNAKWVNRFWFTSLSLSLATAFIAVVSKQWLKSYMTSPNGTPQARARLLHARYLALEKWKIPGIIGLLPFLLYISLLLFFCGMVVALSPIDRAIAAAVGSIGAACCLAYVTSTALSVIIPDCAYKTPLSYMIHVLLHPLALSILRFIGGLATRARHGYDYPWVVKMDRYLAALTEVVESSPTPALREQHHLNPSNKTHKLDYHMILWMHSFSFSPSATSVALQAGTARVFTRKDSPPRDFIADLSDEIQQVYSSRVDQTSKLHRLLRVYMSIKFPDDWGMLPVRVLNHSPLIRSAIRQGIVLQTSAWIDILPLVSSEIFSAELALLAYRPERFGPYWDDGADPGSKPEDPEDRVYALCSLISDSGQQGILRTVCRQVFEKAPGCSFCKQSNIFFDFKGRVLTDSHLQVTALCAITSLLLSPHTVYDRSDLVDTFEEIINGIEEYLHLINSGLPYHDFSMGLCCVLNLLDYLDRVFSRVLFGRLTRPAFFESTSNEDLKRIYNCLLRALDLYSSYRPCLTG